MKNQKDIIVKWTHRKTQRIALACVVLAGVWWGFASLCQAQDAPADFSPGLQQVVNLSKGGMTDDFIQTYITNSGRSYALSVDDIIYLHKQGVSDNVIKTLMQNPATGNPNAAPVLPPPAPPAPVPAANAANAIPATLPPPVDASAPGPVSAPDAGSAPPPTLPYFQAQLAPYGNWVNVAGMGQCWQPVVDPGWRPYYDGGHWVDTDGGWYWQSDYPWGDIVFHYGRWTYTSIGWVWVPGYDYAPSWVVWRHDDGDGCVGWAPLPPGAIFVDGGWLYHGIRVGIDFDFGLGSSFFTFVGYDHFWAHDFRPFGLPSGRAAGIYRRSSFENHYRLDRGVFVNEGLNRGRVAAFTHQEIRPSRMQDVRHQEEQHNVNIRSTDVNRYQINGNRPGSFQPGNRTGNPGQNQWQQQRNNNNGFHGSYNDSNHYPAGFAAPGTRRLQSGALLASSRQYAGQTVNSWQEAPRQEMAFNNIARAGGNDFQHYQTGGAAFGAVHASVPQRASGSLQGGGQNRNSGKSIQH